MTSLLTNVLASATLRQMNATQRDLQQAQGQASSGLRVAEASDDPAYWSIGVTMRSRTGALSAVKDGLALSGSIATVSADALQSIIAQMSGIKNDLVAASQPGVDAAAIDLDLKAKQQQIITIANSASFNGQNWLVAEETTNETIQDVATFDVSRAQTQNVLDRTTNSTASFNETISSAANYARKGSTGTTQMSTNSQHTDTYTTTVVLNPAPNPSLSSTKTLSVVSGAVSTSTTGALDPIDGSIRLVQGYDQSTGVRVATFSDASFCLFTNNSGQVKETNISQYTDQTVDNNLNDAGVSEIVLSNSQATSYNTNSLSTADGILDKTLSVSNASGANKSTLLTMSTIGVTGTDLNTMLQATDTAVAGLVTAAATIGALQTRIDGQTSFNAALSDALTAGVGALTDADMNTTATRIQALQIQQQLQTQALSIANQNTTSILKLFQ